MQRRMLRIREVVSQVRMESGIIVFNVCDVTLEV